MFDTNSFSSDAFDSRSWLQQLIQVVTRFVVRLSSKISTMLALKSEVQ